jgi:hypothetical protein
MTADASLRAWWPGPNRLWPWIVLALTVIPAVWHVVDFDEDLDPEFPQVVRPTFSIVPPAAYRLAEPGDTLDRIHLYMTAAGVVLAVAGVLLARGGGLWPAALAIALVGLWYSATPGPSVDGWHGLGWRTMGDPSAPLLLRAGLAGAAMALAGIVAWNVVQSQNRLAALWDHARARGTT